MSKYYKVHLSSNNLTSGGWANGLINVQVPINASDNDFNWQVGCESFLINLGANTSYMLTLPSLPLGDCTYSSTSQSALSILFINNMNFYQRSIAYNSIGLPISNPTTLRSVGLRIQISNSVTGALFDSTGGIEWSMVLVIYGSPKE